ncbi:MAG: hypothetical protein GQ549_01755 [Gammaproteobacteria bacterium]|nr:hypothetical protein [Gammaproteobacteria bacterium]
MSTALFFITHEGIASSLITIAEKIVQKTNSNLSCLEVPMDADINLMSEAIENKLEQLDIKGGLLFITDVYGGTPSNIAQEAANKYHADLISGVNLPMIIRLLNYRDETVKSLIQKALDGARECIQHKISETLPKT